MLVYESWFTQRVHHCKFVTLPCTLQVIQRESLTGLRLCCLSERKSWVLNKEFTLNSQQNSTQLEKLNPLHEVQQLLKQHVNRLATHTEEKQQAKHREENRQVFSVVYKVG